MRICEQCNLSLFWFKLMALDSFILGKVVVGIHQTKKNEHLKTLQKLHKF